MEFPVVEARGILIFRNNSGKMKTRHNYSSSSLAINDLSRRGFTIDFKADKEGLKDTASGKIYAPSELKVIEQYRFEGMSNPSDMSIVAAIQAQDGAKGVIIASYGTYSDQPLLKLLDAIEEDASA